MKPIIGIVGRSEVAKDGYALMSVHEEYRTAVLKKGGLPILILPPQILEYETTKSKDLPPLTEEEKDKLKFIIDLCDGIIHPGGERIFEYDHVICDYCIEQNKPLLGICMGMQLMGRNLKKIEEPNDHFQKKNYAHEVVLEKGKLKEILKKEVIQVNSRHHYQITDTDYEITARSKDGVIEALELPGQTFHIGVQWHPEIMIDYDPTMNLLWDAFFSCCRKENELL